MGEDDADGAMLGPLLSVSAAEAAVGVVISEQGVEEAEAMLMRGSSPPSMRTAFWRLIRRARAAPTEVAEGEAPVPVVEADCEPPGGEGALPAMPETMGATGPGGAGAPAGGVTDPAVAAAALAAPAAADGAWEATPATVPGTCPASDAAVLAAPAASPGAAAAIPPAALKRLPAGVSPTPAAEAALTALLMTDSTFWLIWPAA